MSNDLSSVSKKRMRSPAYPATDLKEALERAAAIWKNDRNHETNLKSLASHWGFNQTSSSVLGRAAALKHFGLLDEVKGGAAGAVKLTDLAVRILANEDPDSEERIALIKKSALNPLIYAEMWSKYNGQLPSDVTIKSYLVGDRSFNPDVVNSLLKDFRSTISFARLESNDLLNTNDSSSLLQEGGTHSEPFADSFKPPALPNATKTPEIGGRPPKAPPSMKEFIFPLPSGDALLRVPVPFGQSDFEALVDALNVFKRGLVTVPTEPIAVDTSANDWELIAEELASEGHEFMLIGFSYSHHIAFYRSLCERFNLQGRFDPVKEQAFFKPRS